MGTLVAIVQSSVVQQITTRPGAPVETVTSSLGNTNILVAQKKQEFPCREFQITGLGLYSLQPTQQPAGQPAEERPVGQPASQANKQNQPTCETASQCVKPPESPPATQNPVGTSNRPGNIPDDGFVPRLAAAAR